MRCRKELSVKDSRIFIPVQFGWMGRERYTGAPRGDLAPRRTEALLAMAQYADSPFGQFARMALGAWDDIAVDVLMNAIEAVRARAHGSSIVLVGLLGMLYRWGDSGHLPEGVRKSLAEAIVRYPFRNHDIVSYTAEVLAGQRYPDHTFADGSMGTE